MIEPLTRAAVRRRLDAFERMAVAPGVAGVHAAVCLVCVRPTVGADLAVVVTRRSTRLATHRAQFALPGGRLDPGESVVGAGLRELSEEMGMSLPAEAVLGTLDDFMTRSGFRVTPIVVWAADTPFAATPSAAEVSEVHLVPVADLDVVPRFVTIPESDRPVIQMPLLGRRIHAPTGAILHQFAEVVLHGRATRVAEFEQPVFAWR
jgi:8-oxo-dGTP pyrophosphatase MutT (NUDIX family)